MLPPLNLSGDAKRSFFSKPRAHQPKRPLPLSTSTKPSSSPSKWKEEVSIDELSSIPREFFVLETNAVFPFEKYPPTQYQSVFQHETKQWETIVFPALTPSTRQQVVLLRHTLERMRTELNQHSQKKETNPSYSAKRIEYVQKETHVYSICFQELIRQIHCICKEQSDLLHEIRLRYDTNLQFLRQQIAQLQQRLEKKDQQITQLTLQHEETIRANEALVDKTLQAYEQQTIASTQSDGKRTPDDSQRDEEEEDEEKAYEAQWRTQRRSQMTNPPYRRTPPLSREALIEENLAAARVQNAFQKYQLRKEQHRIAHREQKQIAALEIQRSYRGFRDRQLLLHRRAVHQTIYRRRKERAAIEVLQANVRSYLIRKRRERKRQEQQLQQQLQQRQQQAQLQMQLRKQTNAEEENEWSEDAIKTSKEDLAVLLLRFSELAAAFTVLKERSRRVRQRHRQALTTENGEEQVKEETTAPSDGNNSESDDVTATEDTAVDNNGADDEEIQSRLDNKIRQAEHLVGLFYAAVMKLKGTAVNISLHASHSLHRPSVSSTPASRTEGGRQLHQRLLTYRQLSKATSTTDLSSLLLESSAGRTSVLKISRGQMKEGDWIEMNGDKALDSVTREQQEEHDDISSSTTTSCSRPGTAPVHTIAVTASGMLSPAEIRQQQEHTMGDFHLDDAIWKNSATYSPEQLATEQQSATESLLTQIGASYDQRKKLVWLKTFISDIYDTIVGRLRDTVAEETRSLFLKYRCGLAMACDEWHQFIRMNAAPTAQSLLPSCDIVQIIQDHFVCRLGLKTLVESAMHSLLACIECFEEVDLDVRRFRSFLNHERSQDELMFFCMCRLMLLMDASGSRQPTHHPKSMREILDLDHALSIARRLFRVDDERLILDADANVIEHDNALYQKYRPSSGYDQLVVILQHLFSPDEEDPEIKTSQPTDALVRPTNVHQFYSKQYNFTAARSPLVRRVSGASSKSSSKAKWIYFDALVDLLLRYRSEMNHFHLFTQWTRELFHAAAANFSMSQRTLHDPHSPVTHVLLLSEQAFVECLGPLSLGPTERELRQIFVNALKQRHLLKSMPTRVFVSVVLLLLRNGMISVASYRPLEKKKNQRLTNRPAPEDQAWLTLALQWRKQETRFEATVEAIYQTQDRDKAVALHLLQLRNELYELFIYRAGKDQLQRACAIYEQLMGTLDQLQVKQGEHDGEAEHEENDQQEQTHEEELTKTEDREMTPGESIYQFAPS